jgi:uncharacterized protein YndB with AHSA1/START domain
MSSIHQKVTIDAPAEKVFAALTRSSGYHGWWCKDSDIAEEVGGVSALRFMKGGTPVHMKFRVDAIEPARILWTCVEHTMPPWVGTFLSWRLAPAGKSTEVAFEHGGWQGDAPGPVVEGWSHFLASLEKYVETGTGEPW